MPRLELRYGMTWLMPLPWFASALRVPPQLVPARHYCNVQVCPMYSEASQSDLPSVVAAP